MSGIVGIYYLNQQPVEYETLGRMVDILAHRGPDGADVWCEENVGFGHRMLWTTPESLLEKQPLVDSNSNLVLTADARIDNRDELIGTLQINHLSTDKITDSDLILAAYKKWGEQCPKHLLGDFAFAIWDKRKQQLFCARDHMGIKPFYYYRSGRIFVFASEIKALVCLPEVPRRLNELMVAYHLTQFFEDKVTTFYQNIWRLPPAHSLTVKYSGESEPQLYWSLDPAKELRLGSDKEYAEAFREVFTEAVRCRLRSAFPVGSTLSGGLDSSSIACTARQLLSNSGSQKLHTFSAIFPSLPEEDRCWIDERQYMDSVKDLGGFESHDVRADLLNPLIDMLWSDDGAIQAPNLYIHQGIYHSAHQQGVRVVLDGFDGDATVCYGLGYLKELFYKGRWRTLAKEVSALSRQMSLPRWSVLWKFGLSPFVLEPAFYYWQMLRQSIQFLQPTNHLIKKTFSQQVKLSEYAKKTLEERQPLVLNTRYDHWQSLNIGLYSYTLELADQTTNKFSLEGRYPFFDRRLMEFCLALPPEQKLRQGWMRFILRSAMHGTLPPKVQWRTNKANLSPNFKRRLLECERETLEKIVNQPKVIERYVNVNILVNAYKSYASQTQQKEEDSMIVFCAVTLALWLQSFNT